MNHRIHRYAFAALAIAAAVIALTPTAEAVPNPPGTLIASVISASACSDCTPQVSANVSIVWKLSDGDPDPINGGWTYYLNQSHPRPDEPPHAITEDMTGSFQPMPGRPGWVRTNFSLGGSDYDSEANVWTYFFNVSDGASLSVASCNVTIDFRISGNWSGCGSEQSIRPPTGLHGIVTQETSPTSGQTVLRWNVSADDPNQTVGELEYEIFALRFGSVKVESLGIDPTDANDQSGRRYFAHNYTGPTGRVTSMIYRITAYDPLTLRVSTTSCAINIRNGVLFADAECGEIDVQLPGPEAVGPQFPMVNIPAGAASLGVSTTALGLVFGAMLVFVGVFMGFQLAGLAGGVAAGVLGIGLGAVMGLIPWWIVMVLVACAALVFSVRGGLWK